MAKYKNIGRVKAVKQGKVARGPRSRKEEQEFGLAKKEYIVCMDCGSSYFDKSWHRGLDEEKSRHFKKDKLVKFDVCPACKMAREKRYEGELVIKFPISNLEFLNQIKNTVKNSDRQAQDKDPMDRVLWTEEKGDELRVYTSENQLAVKIGKKLKSSLGKGRLTIKHSQEDVTRVYFVTAHTLKR